MDITKFNGWIFDGDGILYSGNELLPGAQKLVKILNSQKKKIALVTNNSTRTLEQYKKKLKKLCLNVDVILTSAYTALEGLDISSAFIVGEAGIYDACKVNGVETENLGVPDAVIVGMDSNFTYNKLSLAVNHILNGARFIATNPDKTLPINGQIAPGAGAMVAAISACVNKEPEFVAGKPAPKIYTTATSALNLSLKECIMVGDRLETDILGASRLGIPSILVKTGIASQYSKEYIDNFLKKNSIAKNENLILDSLPTIISLLNDAEK